MSPRVPQSISWRPTVMGRHYAVSSGHYLATAAAVRALEQGGNAVDAGVAMAMALAILQPDVVSFAGVAPTLIYLRAQQRVVSLAGLGHWPAATDLARLRREGGHAVPAGILRQVVPAAPATHIKALRNYGTFTFAQASAAALALARDGYAMYPELHDGLSIRAEELARYSENREVYLPEGQVPPVGSCFRQSSLARTMETMVRAEAAAGGDRLAGLAAVHDVFYRGEIAQRIVAFHQAHGGFMRHQDLADFDVPEEAPIAIDHQGARIFSCDTWCQGIVMLEALKILEAFDLRGLGHNSTAYIHLVASALNLAFADREAYVGDPRFVDVPTDVLLSEAYAARQRDRIDMAQAFADMPMPGDIAGHAPAARTALLPATGNVPLSPDTIYGCVVDPQGNAYSVTPSDTMYDSPMVPGMGLALSTRGMQGRLQDGHPCLVQPGKRPRLTPTPALALRDGEFDMAWGTPGGDVQCASMLQVWLNKTVFGMSMQQAIEAPRFAPFNFPNSFAPHVYYPARLCVENRIDRRTIAELAAKGYDIEPWSDKTFSAGSVCAIWRDACHGMLHAGADPRRAAYASAW